MSKDQLIMMILQKVSQEPNDQALGEWLRKIIWNLKLDEGQSTPGPDRKLLRD